jgi:hypothetical protein
LGIRGAAFGQRRQGFVALAKKGSDEDGEVLGGYGGADGDWVGA